MASITLKGNKISTLGNLPAVGSTAPAFKLTKTDLSDVTLETYKGKRKVLNVFPSVDTPTCAASVRKFNVEASSLPNTVVLCISADLPFALKRFCGAEGINNVEALSTFRSTFAKDYNLQIADSVLAGLCSRSVIVLDENNKVLYAEQVPEIAQEPDYTKAVQTLK
ncbi:MAG: lipid hydroperoxide peroxidase [Bdellovibrionales bacterium GWA2_49_15]|nr:MAG: lipid hydroperoxide peroxidase [Bdellovibrionales bacterium GWA2_49_15]HAZ12550.1 thiol peroxidase [Bdellovibrionales bacterium]